MKILIDNRWEGNTGIGRLLKEVLKRKPTDIKTDFVRNKYSLGHPITPLYLGNQVKLSGADVFYSPSFMPPVFVTKPFIITIHDLNHLYYYSQFHKFYLKYVIAQIAKNAKAVITVSHYTKNEIIKNLHIRPDKIHVVHNGVDENFFLNTEKYQINRPYFLYIGNRRTYKNIPRMLQAFAEADISKDYLLVMSGVIDDGLRKLIIQLNIKDRVVFLGEISEEELPKIYKGAFAVLFVSLMEGFGLPVIEAMASGVPVITSNITSLPEIAGNAAILVNPLSVSDISNNIEKLVKSKDLYFELNRAGLVRSRFFNWENTGNNTWRIIID
jgi:glycosyltransferase involved in cell wall biosynthesis